MANKIQSGNYILSFRKRSHTSEKGVKSEELCITGYEGHGALLEIPGTALYEDGEGNSRELPVGVVGKKALLGNKGLREVHIPASVRRVGQWAFAQCDQLATVVFEKREGRHVVIERGAFDDDRAIKDICIGYREPDGLSRLVAACCYRLKADHLLNSGDIGSRLWFSKWDTGLSSYLDEPDDEGYTNVVLCGEEDIYASVPDYMAAKRRSKAALCILRLSTPIELDTALRKKFADYILGHTKGCESEEAWEVLLTDLKGSIEYMELLASLGGITESNIDAMLKDLEGEHAETKAYLIGYKQKTFSSGDVFDAFKL
jgi:hypothetical protein